VASAVGLTKATSARSRLTYPEVLPAEPIYRERRPLAGDPVNEHFSLSDPHRWRNPSEKQWARVLWIAFPNPYAPRRFGLGARRRD
jgi:hypothetical protein